MRQIQVMIVDDHGLVRTAFKAMLSSCEGIQVASEAETGEMAIKIARQKRPDVVLMDIRMPGIGGLEATRKLKRISDQIRVLVLTACEDDLLATRVLEAGASGYLTKGATRSEMVQAIRSVHMGQFHIANTIASRIAVKSSKVKDKKNPFDLLSERELQVSIMIANGERVQSIAKKLSLSPKTVNSYRYRIFDKLEVFNDVGLTRLAIRYGLVEIECLVDGYAATDSTQVDVSQKKVESKEKEETTS